MSERLSQFTTRLRVARETSGRSLRQMADSTKLGVRTLDALERGDLAKLPPAIFRRAVVRAYASEVGLDPESTLHEFLEISPDNLPPPGAGAHVIVDAPPRPSRLLRALRLALQIGGAFLPFVAGVSYLALSRAAAEPVAVVAELPPSATTTAGVDDWRPDIVPAAGFVEAPPPVERSVVVRISVSAPCRLAVTLDGRAVRDARLVPGDELEYRWSDSLELSGDDAGAVQFSLNGQAARSLGASHAPLRARLARDDYQGFLIRH